MRWPILGRCGVSAACGCQNLCHRLTSSRKRNAPTAWHKIVTDVNVAKVGSRRTELQFVFPWERNWDHGCHLKRMLTERDHSEHEALAAHMARATCWPWIPVCLSCWWKLIRVSCRDQRRWDPSACVCRVLWHWICGEGLYIKHASC